MAMVKMTVTVTRDGDTVWQHCQGRVPEWLRTRQPSYPQRGPYTPENSVKRGRLTFNTLDAVINSPGQTQSMQGSARQSGIRDETKDVHLARTLSFITGDEQ